MSTAADGTIENKVKQSDKLVTLDLQQYWDDTPVHGLDLKDFLVEGLMLKEEVFRECIDNYDWKQHRGAYLAVHCSTDAIISKWAWMLVAARAAGSARDVLTGRPRDVRTELYRRQLEEVDWERFRDKFVILKGCSSKEKPVPESVYLYASTRLVPLVKKLMYGEACSNVPVYRG
ncbi:MAG: DUF2480 family protein [Balneolaceae bacterium]|nr:DUF2480 family protein [Balneolaceae bacterium]